MWQRCQVHFLRNALSLCVARGKARVVGLLKNITEAETREAALEAIRQVVAELDKRAPKVVGVLEERGEEILAVYALPASHRKKIRTTNLLERQNQELKRRTRVVRVFPHEQSCLRLVTAQPMETNQEWMEKLYLDMGEGTTAVSQKALASAAA